MAVLPRLDHVMADSSKGRGLVLTLVTRLAGMQHLFLHPEGCFATFLKGGHVFYALFASIVILGIRSGAQVL